MKKLLGLYNVKKLIDRGFTIEQISQSIYNDTQKKLQKDTKIKGKKD